ncbi:MAG: DNA primase [Acidobacteria bacterium]|nr:DNA primase [Acidobacteriota bacterium]
MDFASQLKASIDIVRVVGEYVRLQKAGPNSYKGLCPFHTEKTPSFHVRPTHQWFHCFGCGKKGSAIDFVMEIEALSFWEACVQLAERYGIPLPKRNEPSDAETKKRAGAYEAQEIAQKAYRAAYQSQAGEQARAYVARRGVSAELQEEFGLGYAAGNNLITRALEKAGFSPQQMEDSGLALPSQHGPGFYDRFRNRLMFPLHSETGKLIAFAGRALAEGDEPKYMNSPETAIYRKSSVLYNLHRARKPIRDKGYSILVEGYMDVIGLHGAGFQNAIAPCGTAFTTSQVQMLHRHSENVVVNFDPDKAGIAAAERAIQLLLDESMRIKVLELEGGLDPDEFVNANGAEAYVEAIRRAPRYFHWLAGRARSKFDMTSGEGRMAGLQFLIPAIQRIPDKLERAAIAEDVAAYLGVDRSLVLDQFRKMAVSRATPAPPPPPEAGIPANERLLLRCLLRSAEVRDQLCERLAVLVEEQPPRAAAIFRAILAAGEPLDFAAVESRLSDSDRTLLTRLAFADEMEHEDLDLSQAQACLSRMEASGQESQRTRLKQRIREAEREGRLEEAMALMEELNRSARSAG